MGTLDTGHGLTLAQLRLLFAVAEADHGSCSEIARRLGVAASTVTRMADRLAESGHIRREQAPGNRSVVLLTLTDLGHAALQSVLERREAIFTEALEAMAPDAAEQLGVALMSLHHTLGSLGHGEHSSRAL